MSEPIEGGSEKDEAEESEGEFFVASADAAMTFDPAEEVFDLVAVAIIPAMESDGAAARTFGRNANSRALPAEPRAKGVGVEAFVADSTSTTQAGKQWLDRVQIVTLTFRQAQRDGPTAALDDGCELGVDATFGPPNGLARLATAGVGAILVQLDMRTVDIAQFTLCPLRDALQQASEQSRGTPASKARVHRAPRTKGRGQVPPRYSRAQHEEHPREHEPIVLGRPPSQPPPAGFTARTVNFFSLRHKDSGSSQRSFTFIRALGSLHSTSGSLGFENTP